MPLVPHVSSGQIVASSWGNLVADHVVMRFTTAAQRSSQLTTPILNQLTVLDSRPGVIQYWTGSAWADLGPHVQSGQVTGITAGGGLLTVTFPIAFGAPPIVTANCFHTGGAFSGYPVVVVESLSATQVRFRFSAGSTIIGDGANLTAYWIAVGPRA